MQENLKKIIYKKMEKIRSQIAEQHKNKRKFKSKTY